ncbi:MAG: class I SAM-dependent DNA methyltransferase [Candidatus Heimdallarchaeota archaeon]
MENKQSLKSNARSYYEEIAQAFDKIAPSYDRAYSSKSNPLMGWLRQESLSLIQETFTPGNNLLEIGCGTGEEALFLADAGYHILATDISPLMIAKTRKKVQNAAMQKQITALTLSANLLHTLTPSESFDGAYSSFGALNCEISLQRVAYGLKKVLRPKAPFICSVMARWCPFEIFWFLFHFQPRKAVRRLQSPWKPANLRVGNRTTTTVPVRYYSAKEIHSPFLKFFNIERTLSLPLLLPPPYLANLFIRFQRIFKKIEYIERKMREQWPWRNMGDHIAIVLRRK